MVQIPKRIMRDLQAGKGLEETLIKHNTNLKELFSGKYKNYDLSEDLRCIRPTKFNTFTIIKHFGGKTVSFGTYSTLEDAIKMRDILAQNNWDKTKLIYLKEKHNIKDSKGD